MLWPSIGWAQDFCPVKMLDPGLCLLGFWWFLDSWRQENTLQRSGPHQDGLKTFALWRNWILAVSLWIYSYVLVDIAGHKAQIWYSCKVRLKNIWPCQDIFLLSTGLWWIFAQYIATPEDGHTGLNILSWSKDKLHNNVHFILLAKINWIGDF